MLANGKHVRARHAVISNAPVWQTSSLLPDAAKATVRAAAGANGVAAGGGGGAPLDPDTPATPSFVHLHLGIRADGLDEAALRSIHHIVVPEWALLTAPQATAFISIPSLIDPSLAPEGKHVIHAYLPATEPYSVWEEVERGTEAYEALKVERAQPLYTAIERIIPDLRERIEVQLIGSPLTHERYLRRYRGTYGPELSAKTTTFPGARTPIDSLLVCGDSCWPGIGVPAVAGSGIAAAHAVSGVKEQQQLLSEMREGGSLLPA